MLLRQFVNMNVSVGGVLVCSAVIKSAYNSALRILGYLGRRASNLTCTGPFKTPTPVILFFPSPSSGVNEPSVQYPCQDISKRI